MAVISNIQGAMPPRLMGPVKDSTRPVPGDNRYSSPQSTPVNQGAESTGFKSTDRKLTLSEDELRELAENIQDNIDKATNLTHSVGFRFDDRIEDFVIEIHDEQGDLVKQYPPEIVLNLHQKMAELSGMVVDERT